MHQEYKLRDIQVIPCDEVSNNSLVFEYVLILITFFVQIAISNPNREVLLTLSRSGVVEMIGKEWYFVRVHDAVQVCLQHVQGFKDLSRTADHAREDKPSFLQRLVKQRADNSPISRLESGDRTPFSNETEAQLEPLLSRKS